MTFKNSYAITALTSTMYDMSRVNANGYFDAMDADVHVCPVWN